MREQLHPFGRHVCNIKRQYAELKYLKESLQLGEVIIHEDFAENVQMKHQREVMAAHWSNDAVTLFTAVAYYRSGTGDLEHKSYAVISEMTYVMTSRVCMPSTKLYLKRLRSLLQ